MSHPSIYSSRRRWLLRALAATPALLLNRQVTANSIPATPACGTTHTPSQTEGPYFKSKSPLRQRLIEPGMRGQPLLVSGVVMSTRCIPIAGVKLDFWQCDDAGNYDNTGFTLRGHQFTDAQGRYLLESIKPNFYPGRTRHIHVKLQAPHRRVLTTQLYFPDDVRNDGDWIFDPLLLMNMSTQDTSLHGRFNFVLAV